MRQTIHKLTGWVAAHELWFLAIAAPFMIFPFGRWPFLALGLVVLTWLCRWVARGHLTVFTGLDAPILLILLMAIVGYSISVDPALSQTRLWSLILGIIVFYGIVNTLSSDNQFGVSSAFLALLTVGIAGISLLGTDWQQTRMVDIPWIYDHLPSLIRGLPNSGVPRASDLIHPRFVGITMGVLVAVFLAQLFYSRYRNLRLLSLVVVLIGLLTLFLTQTLAGLAGVLVAILFLLVWKNRWFLLIIPFGLIGILIGLFVAGSSQVIQYLLSTNNPIGIAVTLRLDIWSRAIAMIRDMPYTGIGLNTFPVILSNFYPGYLLGPEPHAHNLILQTALDLGLPGLIAFIWLIAVWMYVVWRKYRVIENPEYRILLLGLVAGILAYLTHGFMDAMMLGAKPSVAIWILLGIGAAPVSSHSITGDAMPERSTHYLRSILSLALFITVILAAAILKPASFYMNLGAIHAHHALFPTQVSDPPNFSTMEKARETLIETTSLDLGYLNAYELLGRIYAWEGDPGSAMIALAHRVALDRQDPLLHYFPSEHWLRQVQRITDSEGQNWKDLIKVYSQWKDRYPGRAELYVEQGLVWQCYLNDIAQSAATIKTGIDKQAIPSELLEYYQYLLSQGESAMCINK